MIEIKEIYKSFSGKPVLRNLNLKIQDGETLTIIGRSGCGKSVLLKIILRLLTPDKGTVIIDGEDITGMNYSQLKQVRRKFGILFQSSALFDSMSVEENIALPLVEHSKLEPPEIQTKVEEALQLVGLPGAQKLYPSELSGGMKKRVGLARAIVYRPQYVLYDEPTTGLDPIMADTINQLILEMNGKLSVTSVVVTHDIVSACKVSNRIVMLHYGEIIYSGTPEEIKKTEHPTVKQFIEGTADGPIKPIHRDHIRI
jgi:phospholipid/cholesterol/gamma-HCH transport system ATP-binding protein